MSSTRSTTHPVATPLADAVMARCEQLAGCSEEACRLTRRFLSPPMAEVHTLVAGWMRDAGLHTRVDDAGNLIGRLPVRGSAGPTNRTLLIGSHLDTVPGGGWYDGVLGVLVGLAAIEMLAEAGGGSSAGLPFNVDVIGFSEEEGVRFSKPYLGSAAMAGAFDAAWLDRVDEEGKTLRQAIADFGLDADRLADAAYDPGDVVGYLEPHLEQGPVLDRAGSPVGLVSGVAGQSRLRLAFHGEAGHAGTTPMLGRHDALFCASRFVRQVGRIGKRVDGLRATVGRMEVLPNAPNVIPARVNVSLDVRHIDDAVRERSIGELLAEARRIAGAEACRFEVLEDAAQPAVAVDKHLSGVLGDAVSDCGHEPLRLPSGAGHDAVIMASRFPVAMLFLRHPGGVSHHPDERVERDDVAVGIEAVSRFVHRLAERENASA